ncbi:MAG TPA: response regulator [Smithellaceae bacterium]|nr:response regulator [Smithellaceae bacterium]HRS89276.1 response regulator [Smithellaceae bacterium]HRV27052.1 response regulator [Smithellaceae bacterium]
MINTASNFETLKQRMTTSPQDSFFKGKLSRVYEVLIVDDEEPFVLSLADGLSTYKKYFNVRTAPNGAEAVKILKLSPVDLVITDLSMPKMDGFELLAYMNRNYPKIPVILMTAYGTPKIEEIVSNMGIFRYLEKPLDINAVADNIVDALGIKISITETKAQTYDRPDISYKPADTQSKVSIPKKSAETAKIQDTSETEDKSKTTATFGSRASLDLEKIREEARLKAGVKTSDKKSVPDAEKRAMEAAEKRAILEAKAKAEAERFAREEAERKAQEAEEKARQEALAREEAERKAREAEEKAERARQEALAREEAIKRAKAEAEERARQEALAREEAIKKAKAEAEAEERARKEAQAREEAERKAKEAEERARKEAQAREEAERKAKEAEERARQEALAKEEALKKERAEAEAQAQAENDKKQKDLKSETKQKLSAWKKS